MFDSGQAEVKAGMAVSQTFVIEAHQVEDRGEEVSRVAWYSAFISRNGAPSE